MAKRNIKSTKKSDRVQMVQTSDSAAESTLKDLFNGSIALVFQFISLLLIAVYLLNIIAAGSETDPIVKYWEIGLFVCISVLFVNRIVAYFRKFHAFIDEFARVNSIEVDKD